MSSDILVFAAAATFVLGYLIINQAALRIMLLIGTGLYIWYYAVVNDTPLWPAIWASGATGLANLIGLSNLFIRRSKWIIPRRDVDIYPSFSALPPGDFRKLMLLARREKHAKDSVLTTVGAAVPDLYYVISGLVDVQKKDGSFTMHRGNFVGEVAFLTNEKASATVVMAEEGELLSWDANQLRARAERDARFRLALDAMISLDLARKVAQAGAPRSTAEGNLDAAV
ncbi:cyclic nucleotide-binding domain-containing protein [Aliiroseovarius sp. PrR006]|uniref:cyclic nucleotide-binding domain-containing protein n=1 Tax=Aliiroseovarius sp. PrR006 TaxID=2706883 RepID=UPI0013D15CFD|nr:cyclic nucleotide-binding domain-containing protein [Aliiroseovarius sp. PrR006]NDW53452.1 cyclic nucleotide-binding domain-containing protein [Aliiroseovarius sp. PrR006]